MSQATTAVGDKNQTKGDASDVRKDVQSYVKGMFSSWSS